MFNITDCYRLIWKPKPITLYCRTVLGVCEPDPGFCRGPHRYHAAQERVVKCANSFVSYVNDIKFSNLGICSGEK